MLIWMNCNYKNYDSERKIRNMAAITVAFVFGTLAYDMYKVICRK